MSDRRIREGILEQRTDLPPVRKQYRDWRTGLVHERLSPIIDCKVYETWREDEGNLMGRWTWKSGL